MTRFLFKGVLLLTCFTSFAVLAEPLSIKFTSPNLEKVSFVSVEAKSHKAQVPKDVIQKFEAILAEELHQSKQFEDGGEMVIQYTIDKYFTGGLQGTEHTIGIGDIGIKWGGEQKKAEVDVRVDFLQYGKNRVLTLRYVDDVWPSLLGGSAETLLKDAARAISAQTTQSLSLNPPPKKADDEEDDEEF